MKIPKSRICFCACSGVRCGVMKISTYAVPRPAVDEGPSCEAPLSQDEKAQYEAALLRAMGVL